jgi:PhoH-like ATPase
MDFMLDTKIPLVSVCGLAGSGKTMAAIAAALHMVDKGLYSKIVITRPVVSLSTNIGMLPGDKLDKMKPWIQPVFDNAKWLLKGGNGHIDLLIEKGVLEIESLSYIRGRTFPNTIFIVDECQNTTISEMKSIITRMGVNSKLILIGDIEQIDSPKIDMFNSGLSTVISKFKGTDLAAHVTLVKSERSELAALAAKIL